jgi:glycosyltransferase involved in cell wall biosynthesis
MLDAAACGLPIVVNDTLAAVERIQGNGRTYRINDVPSLVAALKTLESPEERRRLGNNGAAKMSKQFSWTAIARVRLEYYRRAIEGRIETAVAEPAKI